VPDLRLRQSPYSSHAQVIPAIEPNFLFDTKHVATTLHSQLMSGDPFPHASPTGKNISSEDSTTGHDVLRMKVRFPTPDRYLKLPYGLSTWSCKSGRHQLCSLLLGLVSPVIL